jgi:hypothetical protein
MTGHTADQQHGTKTATAAGVPHPDGTDRWLVPPWRTDAELVELVQHFQRFQPAIHAGSAIHAAYYSRYATVLAATSSGDIAESLPWRWFTELLGAVSRAAVSAGAEAEADHEAALNAAQASMQLTLVRALGLNTRPIEGQAL